MKRRVRAALRRISAVVRRSPWLTEQIRNVLMRLPGLRARLLRVNSDIGSNGRYRPPLPVDIGAIESAATDTLSPAAQDAYRNLVAHLKHGAR